jgi:hypothetical protein
MHSLRVFAGAAILATMAFLFCGTGLTQTRQEHVHHQAHSVMPFDISKTLHIFKMTTSGGIQRVVAKDPGDREQTLLIRRHLQREAEKFQRGDF